MSTTLLGSHIKGTEALTIRQLLLQSNVITVEAFCAKLSPASRAAFEQATPNQWIPENEAFEFYALAASVLFPGREDDMEQLGRALAQHALGGIYKSMMTIMSVTFLIKRAPMLWTLYHSAGKAEIHLTPKKHQGRMIVRGAPEMNPSILRAVSGFSVQALEMAGGLSVQCQLRLENPDAWEWIFDWVE